MECMLKTNSIKPCLFISNLLNLIFKLGGKCHDDYIFHIIKKNLFTHNINDTQSWTKRIIRNRIHDFRSGLNLRR